MIKKKLFLSIVSVFILGSCSNDDFVVDSVKKSDVPEIDVNGILPIGFYEKFIQENSDKYEYGSSNSHLWVNESDSDLRTANKTYTVVGYDEVKYVNDLVFRCQNGVTWDSRVKPYGGTNLFVGNIREYIKYVRIPKGATLVLPPQSVIDKIPSIGRYPIGSSVTAAQIPGYNYKLKSSTATEDIYALITEAMGTTYNGEGRELFRPPFYIPEKAKDGPASFQFKYQYTYAEWD